MKIEYLNEIWKDIKGYEGLYQVSNYGRIKNKNYRRTGREYITIGNVISKKSKYYRVLLTKDKESKWFLVHRLVAFAFPEICGEYFEGAEVDHINTIVSDNRAINLRWVNHKINCCNPVSRINNSCSGRNNKKSKPVLQFDLDGNFIKEWPSMREIQRQLGFYQSSISLCCNGKLKKAYGYIWKYK